MTGATFDEASLRLLDRAGFGAPSQITALAGGANNRVFRVDTSHGPIVLKAYFRRAGDAWDRLRAEWSFANFAWSAGIRVLPQPLAVDFDASTALYAYVAGRPLTAAEIGTTALDQAVSFFAELNRHRLAAAELQPAAEACFSVGEHLRTIGGRVAALAEMKELDAHDREAAAFVRDSLAPAWAIVRERIAAAAGSTSETELAQSERCVSPSDFGFHNAVMQPDGRLAFLDFEYAGWDDPAKTIGDFFNQVALPVSAEFFDGFVAAASLALDDRTGALAARARLLLPAYTVKWCCILLNEFRFEDRERRRYAGTDSRGRKADQLRKAQTHFARLQPAGPQAIRKG
jgi:hypothetical protein